MLGEARTRPRSSILTQGNDTNGDGKITKPWNEPAGRGGGGSTEFDPALDTRVIVGAYGTIANPVDDSVWIASDRYPGQLLRLDPGDNPPETCISELYTVPVERGYRPRVKRILARPRNRPGSRADPANALEDVLAGSLGRP